MTMPLLETQALHKAFGGLQVTKACDLQLLAGEIHALIGPNGAGKTTLLAQLAGSLAPDRGRIFFEGGEITQLPTHRRVQRGLVQTFQITTIFAQRTVLENLLLSVQAVTGHSFRFWWPRQRETQLEKSAIAVAEQVGLGDALTTVASTLSHGEQRQLELGLALACRPKLLLLDEPLAGMGLDESARMIDLIRTLNAQVTVLLVEHDMDAVFQLADRISVLVYGEIIATGSPTEIRENKVVQDAYLG